MLVIEIHLMCVSLEIHLIHAFYIYIGNALVATVCYFYILEIYKKTNMRLHFWISE